jgi:hypothetical protein
MCMKHMLNWMPGKWGKGLIHDGGVHTWNTDTYDNEPTHPQYAEEVLGMTPSDWLHHPDFDSAFLIHPTGKVSFYEPKYQLEQDIQNVDPRLVTDREIRPTDWNFQNPWSFKSRVAMSVREDFWQQWPGELYHGTTRDRLLSIMQHGLQPWDSEIAGGSRYEDGNVPWLKPRPNHVYLSPDPSKAYQRAREASDPEQRIVVLKIDPRQLAAPNINPDEDDMRHYIPGAPTAFGDSQDIKRELGNKSLGEWAEEHGWGDPEDTERSINDENTIAHKGFIPPHAITPGVYDVDMDEPVPRQFKWQPIEWPRTASLIDDMRDGWGRFAVAAPWEYGKSGKGLYFPDTGALQTWADDRTHLDVWDDDENYAQDNAHHLMIRPNGTVRDQGCLDRDFVDIGGDREGLRRALNELDPRLRLDAPNTWDFGATEPMEEEPSSVSRGEEGGILHGVQTGGDYAGSL